MSASFPNRRSICSRFPLAAAATCLLLAACDHTAPAKVEPPGAATGEKVKADPVATAPAADRPHAIAPRAVASSAADQKSTERVQAKPDPGSPVTATVRTDKNAVRVGDSFTVAIDVQIASGWHIYAVDRPTGLSVPTKIKLQLPAGLESAGDWKTPEPALDDSSAGEPAFVYHDTAAFQQTIRVKPSAPAGPTAIPVEFHYQACDRFSCRAPATLKLQTSIQIVP